MSLGGGCPYSISTKQKINTRSSTKAELVGVNDAMAMVIWTRLFLQHQGFHITDNVIYQDNQSAILLEENGRRSSSKKTRHIEIRYYFITDNIARRQARVSYCPTKEMIADFFTKPLQGSSFCKFRSRILNLPTEHVVPSDHYPPSPESQECVGTPSGCTQNDLHQDGDSPTSGEPNRDPNMEVIGTPNPDHTNPRYRAPRDPNSNVLPPVVKNKVSMQPGFQRKSSLYSLDRACVSWIS